MASFGAHIKLQTEWISVPVLERDGVNITSGRQKNSGEAETTLCNLTLRNPDGRFSSRNVRSPYRGLIKPFTPFRAVVPDDNHLYFENVTGTSTASTPDHASLDITGTIDVRIDIEPNIWDATEKGFALAEKYVSAGDQRSWSWFITADRRPCIQWSSDGTIANALTIAGDTPITVPSSRRVSLRALLYFVPGVGVALTFYTSSTPGLAGPWTQLGATLGGTTPLDSIASTTAPLTIGESSAFGLDRFHGRIHAFQLRSGMDGAVVADPDFTAQPAGQAPFVDSAGRTWAMFGDAEIRDFDVRMTGEIPDWPTRWNVSGRDITSPIFASGLFRRLKRPSTPLRSPMVRESLKPFNRAQMAAYWPGEDSTESQSIASAIGGPAMIFQGPEPRFASNSRFPGSAPLLVLQAGTALAASVPAYTHTGAIHFHMLMDVPAGGFPANTRLAELGQSTGEIRRWILRSNPAGDLRLHGLADDGTEAVTTGDWAYAMNGLRVLVGFNLSQSGSNITWQIFSWEINPDLSVSQYANTGTWTGQQTGRVFRAGVAVGGNMTDTGIGHITISSGVDVTPTFPLAMVGNNREPAARRVSRLVAEEYDLKVRIVGNIGDSAPMGPQRPETLWKLLQACENADGGALFEPRDFLGVGYRTRSSIYDQAPVVLTYGQEGESPHLDPEEPGDDVVNDVTVSRRGGSSANAVDSTSRLSVLEHPDGVGRLDGGQSDVEVATDDQLPDLAGWELHHGTWDEYRYPRVELNLTRLRDAGKAALARAISRLRVADSLMIMNPPPWLPARPIDLLAQGFTETIRPGSRTFGLNTSPGGPWRTAVIDDARIDTDKSEIAVEASATATTLSVAVLAGDLWTTDPADFPLDADFEGVRIRVTAITGTSTPQTWTVQRSMDGFDIPLPVGTDVRLWNPSYIAL